MTERFSFTVLKFLILEWEVISDLIKYDFSQRICN